MKKPLTAKQIEARLRKAPRNSQFDLVVGKQYRQWGREPEWVLSRQHLVRREGVRQMIEQGVPIFEIAHRVVRNVNVKSIPAEFLKCLD